MARARRTKSAAETDATAEAAGAATETAIEAPEGGFSADPTRRAGQIAHAHEAPDEETTTATLHSDLTGPGGTLPNPVNADTGEPIPAAGRRGGGGPRSYTDVPAAQLESTASAAPAAPVPGEA